MRVTATRSAVALAVVVPLALLVGLTGCTSPVTSTTSHSTHSSTKGTTTAHDGTVTQVTHAPGTTTGYVGALKDVELTSCSADKAPAHFDGTVTNPTSTSQSYRIYVSLQSGGNTVGVREVDVTDVAGHATQKWSGTLDAGKAGTTCVLRVERHS